MARPMPADGCYAGRRANGAVLNVTLDREAKDLLQQWAPKQIGAYVARLVYQEQARKLERARLLAEVQSLI